MPQWLSARLARLDDPGSVPPSCSSKTPAATVQRSDTLFSLLRVCTHDSVDVCLHTRACAHKHTLTNKYKIFRKYIYHIEMLSFSLYSREINNPSSEHSSLITPW